MEVLSESAQRKAAGEKLGGEDLGRGKQEGRDGKRRGETGKVWSGVRKSCAKSQWGELPGRSGLTECPMLRTLSEIKAEECLLLPLDSGGKMEASSRLHRKALCAVG